MAGSTVLSLWLPVRETDEAAIEAGAAPDVFRVRVPHAAPKGGELTQLQKDVARMAEEGVREVHLVINKSFKYPKQLAYLNTMSRAVACAYNEWADADADVEEEEDDDDDEEEDKDDEEDDDEDEEEDDGPTQPPAKKAKPAAAPATRAYEVPCATTLTPALFAAHLNVTRPCGEPVRAAPFAAVRGEHFVTVFVSQDEGM